jgi:hypothetical protein
LSLEGVAILVLPTPIFTARGQLLAVFLWVGFVERVIFMAIRLSNCSYYRSYILLTVNNINMYIPRIF